MRIASFAALIAWACVLAACNGSSGSGGGSGSGSSQQGTCTSSTGAGSEGSCKSPLEVGGATDEPVLHNGTVGEDGSYYRFNTTPGAYYRVTLTAANANLDLFVYGAGGRNDGNWGCLSRRAAGNGPEACIIQAAEDTLDVDIYSQTTGTQAFQLALQTIPALSAQGTAETPVDLGPPPILVTGSVDTGTSYYVVTGVTEGVVYTVRVTNLDGYVDLYASNTPQNPSTPQVATCKSTKFENEDESCSITSNGAPLHIWIDGAESNAGATFQLSVQRTGGGQINEGTAAQPVQLTVGESRASEVKTESFYRFDTTPGVIYDVTGYNLVVYDDDATFADASAICGSPLIVGPNGTPRCLFQASGSAAYLRATSSYSSGQPFPLAVAVYSADLPLPGWPSQVPLVLARGVTSYTPHINIVPDTGSGYRGQGTLSFRGTPGQFYRIIVDPNGVQMRALTLFTTGFWGCVYSTETPGEQHCITPPRGNTVGVDLTAWASTTGLVNPDISIEEMDTPVAEGTRDAPVDLGTAPLSATGQISNVEYSSTYGLSYYKIHVIPGVTYSFTTRIPGIRGMPLQYTNVDYKEDALTESSIWSGGWAYGYFDGQGYSCCVITPTSDVIMLAVKPYRVAGGFIDIEFQSHEDELPAEGIVGGPAALGTIPVEHQGTVSRDHSVYTVQAAPKQLVAARVLNATNPNVRIGGPCSVPAQDGECRFYATGTSDSIVVQNGPATFTLSVYPGQMPLNEGTSSVPYVLAGPVVHEGTVGHGYSYYSYTVPSSGNYEWWVETIDGSVTAYQQGTADVPYYCYPNIYSHCSTAGGIGPIFVNGGEVGSHFKLHIEAKP